MRKEFETFMLIKCLHRYNIVLYNNERIFHMSFIVTQKKVFFAGICKKGEIISWREGQKSFRDISIHFTPPVQQIHHKKWFNLGEVPWNHLSSEENIHFSFLSPASVKNLYFQVKVSLIFILHTSRRQKSLKMIKIYGQRDPLLSWCL